MHLKQSFYTNKWKPISKIKHINLSRTHILKPQLTSYRQFLNTIILTCCNYYISFRYRISNEFIEFFRWFVCVKYSCLFNKSSKWINYNNMQTAIMTTFIFVHFYDFVIYFDCGEIATFESCGKGLYDDEGFIHFCNFWHIDIIFTSLSIFKFG